MELDYSEEISFNKRRKLEDDPPQATTGMEILPRDVVLDILSRLPITSLVQFKFVCKSWLALVQDPLIANLQLSTKSHHANNNPCLILHCDSPIRNQLYFIEFSGHNEDEKSKVRKFHLPFQAKMSEYDVVGSCNGLLALSDSLYNDAFYIYNPFTRDYIELPKSMQYPDQEVVFGFGFHPETKQYKVIKVVYYRKSCSNSNYHQRTRRIIYRRSEVQVYTLGSPAWRSLGKSSHQFVRQPSEALVNGRLHWVTKPRRYNRARRIVSFDLADEEFREVPKPDCGGLNRCNFHLAVLGGCLSAAVGNYGKLEIWVMKDYKKNESWIKEYNIGAYIPKVLKQNLNSTFRIWKNPPNGRVRVVCALANGQILLEYKNRVLVSYEPKGGKFRDLMFQSLPNWFQTIVHQGSFNWIDNPLDT